MPVKAVVPEREAAMVMTTPTGKMATPAGNMNPATAATFETAAVNGRAANVDTSTDVPASPAHMTTAAAMAATDLDRQSFGGMLSCR